MVLIATSLLFAAQADVAYVARYYKPGTQKSRFELYLSDIDGTHRKLLPTTEAPAFVQWVGHDRLAWFSEKHGLWTSKLSPWRPKLITRNDKLSFEESRLRRSEPGTPEIVKEFDRSNGVWTISPTTLTLVPSSTLAHNEYLLSDDKPTEIPNPSDSDRPLSLKYYEEFKYWDGEKEADCEWQAFRAYTSDAASKLWLVIGSHTSTSGSINGIMLFAKGQKPKTLFENANAFDFSTNRDIYAYCTPRDTSSLGKLQVWTSELHIGNWKNGEDHAIAKGLVWVPSVNIRP